MYCLIHSHGSIYASHQSVDWDGFNSSQIKTYGQFHDNGRTLRTEFSTLILNSEKMYCTKIHFLYSLVRTCDKEANMLVKISKSNMREVKSTQLIMVTDVRYLDMSLHAKCHFVEILWILKDDCAKSNIQSKANIQALQNSF